MRKLRLDIEALAVETFFPEGVTLVGGTVVGNDDSFDTCGCPAPPPTGQTECTCPKPTCGVTCNFQYSCWFTCTI